MTQFAELTGRTIVVTGASRGIGRAIVREVAAAGADVLIHFGQARQEAEQIARQLQDHGVQSSALGCDFTNADGYTKFVDEAWNWRGRIDGWVNNAGVDLLTGVARELSYAEKLQRLWEIDVRSTVLLSKLVVERMQGAQIPGVILTVGWDQADRGMEGDSGELFAAAKNAIMGFTRSLAVSVAPGIRVNGIAPGWIQTAWGETAGPLWQERVLRETPLKRWGQPEDIARLARFLLSDDSAYITGQILNANGGAVR